MTMFVIAWDQRALVEYITHYNAFLHFATVGTC